MPVKKKTVVPPGALKKIVNSHSTTSDASSLYKQGPKRPYLSTEVPESTLKVAASTHLDRLFIHALLFLGVWTRLLGVSKPYGALFDEIHIVNSINNYLRGEFFISLNLPLSNIFYTVIARVVGYNGNANLSEVGESYIKAGFPYVVLRVVAAIAGIGTIPLFYFTLRSSGVRSIVAAATTLLLVLENSMIVTSRVFLPDSIFVLFFALSVYAFKKFELQKLFSKGWSKYLVLTGICLGLSVSTKIIGTSTIIWVVILSVQSTWYLLGDLQVTNCQIVRATLSKVHVFIVIPFIIYLSSFYLHILLTPNFTDSASLLSSDYQRTLKGNDLEEIPEFVPFGATVTIRHTASLGGFLHSHEFPYKSGSGNQQVSVFDYKDFNNEWVIEPVGSMPINRAIRHDALLRLRHKNTGSLLRVSDFKPPISEQDYDSEVSCFGNSTFEGGDEEVFQIILDGFNGDRSDKFLRAIDKKFQLRSKKKGCFVLSHDLKLPEWGFRQQEVLCVDPPSKERSLFFIETNKFPEDFDTSTNKDFERKIPVRNPSFFRKFLELNYKMWRIFKGIDTVNVSSQEPIYWPFLTQGINFLSRPNQVIYVLGNPINWWLTLGLIPTFLFVKGRDFIITDTVPESIVFKTQALSFFIGWLVHYIPYVLNEGEYFLIYYEPALYFGLLLIGVTFEYIYSRNHRIGKYLIVITSAFAFYFYYCFLPITYGTPWKEELCESVKIFDSWAIDCTRYK